MLIKQVSSLCLLHLTLYALLVQTFKHERHTSSPPFFLKHPLKALLVAPFAYTPDPRSHWPLEPRAQPHPSAGWRSRGLGELTSGWMISYGNIKGIAWTPEAHQCPIGSQPAGIQSPVIAPWSP